MEELQIRPGDVIASKYRVEKVLGAGGMGVVVAARHVALGNLVAVKIMQPRAMSIKGAVDRFLREGQAAAALASKHVAKVIDVGQLDTGTPYMIMEHLAGSDLSSIIEKKGAIPLASAAEYLLQACDGIGEAHAKGIVHRDLKPANLFLLTEPDGTPLIKVLDFGIAKVSGSEQGLTGTSQGMGSGGYMSPEQMSSAKKVDHRADIWALGVTFYELVTAHRPFAADSLEQFVTAVIWGEPTPLATYRPDLPPDVEAVILRCLEKQPDNRFSTVAHLAQRLAAYAPPRAHVYVGRVASLLGMGAPSLAQTASGMQAPPAQGGGGVPTAFGPAPQVAVAAAHPLAQGQSGAPARTASPTGPVPHAGPPPTIPDKSGPHPLAASQSGPPPLTANQSGPHPVSANQSGPHPLAASQSGPHPVSANQSGPHPVSANQSGPHPLAASQSGPHPLAASQSGPRPAMSASSATAVLPDGRVSTVPGISGVAATGPVTAPDLTGERARASSQKKPPIALFAIAAVALVGLGGGGVWLLTRPAAPPSDSGAPPPVTATTTSGVTGAPDKPAPDSVPSGAPEVPVVGSGAASAGAGAAPIVSGSPSPGGKSVPGSKSTATAKTGPSASASASASATAATSSGIGGPRN